jgi:glycosyltransferase involved in cell wall biosynthesis
MLKENSKKRIVVLGPKVYQLFNDEVEDVAFGGAEVQLYLLGKAIAKKGFEVTFLVGDFGQESVEYYDGMRVVKTYKMNDSSLKKIVLFLKELIKAPAHYYLQRAYTELSPLFVFLAHILNRKFIYMVAHDSEVDGSHRLMKNNLSKRYARYLWKKTDSLICQNQYQMVHLKELNKKVSFLTNSHEIPEKDNTAGEYFLWVGRSAPWKRPELYLELASKFPDEKFMFVLNKANQGDMEFEKIKGKALDLENVEFIESVHYSKIPELYRRAKIFVNTSTQEGFPNTFIDAGKWGVPIASLNVNPNMFITEHNCGIVGNDDLENFVSEIQLLLENKEKYDEMSENIYKYMNINHNIENNVLKLIDIITNEEG